MRNTNHRKERGIALLLSVLALLLLSAVAAGMIYMASTENSIAANFKSEETEYFAARAGIEEVRDRMIPSQSRRTLQHQLAVAFSEPAELKQART